MLNKEQLAELEKKVDALLEGETEADLIAWLKEHRQKQALQQCDVSRSAVADIVAEAEKRVTKCIKDDMEYGYDMKMIRGKIKMGSYIGSSVETLESYKRHFG